MKLTEAIVCEVLGRDKADAYADAIRAAFPVVPLAADELLLDGVDLGHNPDVQRLLAKLVSQGTLTQDELDRLIKFCKPKSEER